VLLYPDLPDLSDATVTVAHGGQPGLKVLKKLTEAPNNRICVSPGWTDNSTYPIYGQVAIKHTGIHICKYDRDFFDKNTA